MVMQVEFGLPDLESRTQIFQIHTRTMNCERNIRFELLARCAFVTGIAQRESPADPGPAWTKWPLSRPPAFVS